MERLARTIIIVLLLSACSHAGTDIQSHVPDTDLSVTPESVASILASLPLEGQHLREVYDAVESSSCGGFDEEYLMSDLFRNPGSGVHSTKASGTYSHPIRELFEDYLSSQAATKSEPGFSPEAYIDALMDSDIQLYFPYHEQVDAGMMPVITFDPGLGMESNYGYEIVPGEDGGRSIRRVIVDEAMARTRPVWVVNTNDDSAFTPLDMYVRDIPAAAPSAIAQPRCLMLKTFKMMRNYDSWFAGASEFVLRIGSVEGFKATTEAELALYRPSITDLMIVVKRNQVGRDIPYDAVLITDFTSQLDKLAFLLTEDDGGTHTSWKCEAVVKVESKSYGFTLDLPYKDKDDVVWRGQLASSFFKEADVVTGRFGDVVVSFALE